MDLVERYLAAIRRNLPPESADDIAAEIADDIQTRREDREEALGRPLTRAETSTMLKSFGHPLVVAARYRPHQYLIGPELYPFYLHVMKIALAVGATLFVALGVISFILGESDPFRAALHSAGDLFSFFLLAVAIVTLIFAMLERAGFPAEHIGNWMPENLPDPLDRPQSRWESAFEVGLGIAFLLWWIGVVKTPSFGGVDSPIRPGPAWDGLYLPILILLCAQLAAAFLKWLRPRWKVAASLMTIATCIAALTIIAALWQADSWVVASPAAVRDGTAGIADSVNLAIRIGLLATAVIITLQALHEAWKLVRRRR